MSDMMASFVSESNAYAGHPTLHTAPREEERINSLRTALSSAAKMRILGLRRRASGLRTIHGAVDGDKWEEVPGRNSLSALNETAEAPFADRATSPRPSHPLMLQYATDASLPFSYTNTLASSQPQSRSGQQFTKQSPRPVSQLRRDESDSLSSRQRGSPLPESLLTPHVNASSSVINLDACSSDGEGDGYSKDSFSSSQASYDLPTPVDFRRHKAYSLRSADDSRNSFLVSVDASTSRQPRTLGSLHRQVSFPVHASEASSLSSKSYYSSAHTPSTSVTTISSTGSSYISPTFCDRFTDKIGPLMAPAVPNRSPKRTPSRNFSRPTISDLNIPLRRSTGPVNTTAAFAQYTTKNDITDATGKYAPPRARMAPKATRRKNSKNISSDDAASVLLLIMSKVEGFRDLLSLGSTNKGFYGVFKNNKLALVKSVLRNKSSAAWELREASPKEIIISGPSSSDYTPMTYVQFYTRDTYTLMQLRAVIFVRCKALLRPETFAAIRERHGDMSRRIDSALWRIWTFCTIFGAGEGGEADYTRQVDWLNGGALAHPNIPNEDMPYLEASEASARSFGRGNPGGLSADDLRDITEMWNCIKALLANIKGPGRVAQARAYGVFDRHKAAIGDFDAEKRLLEEWVYHLGTLGLSAVLDLAGPSTSQTASVYITAKSMGWTRWRMPKPGVSLSGFFDEPLSRVYEQRMVDLRGVADKARSQAAANKAEDTATGGNAEFGSWMRWMNEHETPNRRPKVERGLARESVPLRSVVSTETSRKSLDPHANARPLPLSLFPPEYKHAAPTIPTAAAAAVSSPSPPRTGEQARPSPRSMIRAPSRDLIRPTLSTNKTSPGAFPPSSYKPTAIRQELPRSQSSQDGGRPSTSSSIGFALASIMDRGFSRDEAKSVFRKTGEGMRADVSRAISGLFERIARKEQC